VKSLLLSMGCTPLNEKATTFISCSTAKAPHTADNRRDRRRQQHGKRLESCASGGGR
jgi:hypothetical protein